jgi:apolipoprotein D and lipocalin family protein
MKLLVFILSLSAFAGGSGTVATDEVIDVNRYIGKWYAISSLPQRFTKGCLAQTADYDILSDKKISVTNTCIKKSKSTTINGEARITNTVTNSELEVRFYTWWARLFRLKGDYNIIKIDTNYDYVLIGGNDRKSLWIMSRTTSMNETDYNEYVEFAKKKGFKVDKLVFSKFK